MLALLGCGLRRSEAALAWKDIDRWKNGTYRLLAGHSRTEQTGEVVLFTRQIIAALDEFRQVRGDSSPAVSGMTTKTIKLPYQGDDFGRAVLWPLQLS